MSKFYPHLFSIFFDFQYYTMCYGDDAGNFSPEVDVGVRSPVRRWWSNCRCQGLNSFSAEFFQHRC